MTDQIIYSMVRVGRMFPPNKQVLRNISLSFFYGAKIGVLGLNAPAKAHCCALWPASIQNTAAKRC